MLKPKPEILIFIDWYAPAFKGGGIISSCVALVENLKNDFSFKIITRNSDLGSKEVLKNIESDKWNSISENVKVLYLSRENISIKKIREILRNESFDAIYLNGIFSFYFNIVPLVLVKKLRLKTKIIIAPMGMLCEGALRFKKIKKKSFLQLTKFFNIFKNITWHVSSRYELGDLKKAMGKNQNAVIAPYLFKPAQIINSEREKKEGVLRMTFISRISPKKNLMGALRILQKVKTKGKIIFDIYGPVEDNKYWQRCISKLKHLPDSVKFTYKGVLNHKEVITTFQKYDVSILPTFSENFGQIIPESLIAATPVIISDQTPWDDLNENNAGWMFALNDEKSFVNSIEELVLMNDSTFSQYRDGAYSYAQNLIDNKDLTSQTKLLFETALQD